MGKPLQAVANLESSLKTLESKEIRENVPKTDEIP